MKPKTLFQVLAPLMAALLLPLMASCSPTEAPQATAEQPAATTAAAPAAAAEPIKLTFWNYWGDQNGVVLQSLIDQYTAEHPNVQIENVTYAWDQLQVAIQTAIAGGEVPHIAAVDRAWMATFATSEDIVILDPNIEASGIDVDDFYPGPLSDGRYGGHQLSLPASASNLQLYYNKELFTGAGLDPDNPPSTWEELAEYAQACANPDSGVIGMEIYTQGANEGLTWQWQVYLWQAGGEFLNEDNTAAAFNSPAGERATQFLVDLINSDASANVAWGQFEQGLACMRMDGSWTVGNWAANLPFDFGTAPMPYPADGEPATNMGGEQIFLFETTPEEQQAAWDFVAWFTGTEAQIAWDEGTAMMPVRASVAQDPGYQSWVQNTEPRMISFIEGQQYARTRPTIPNYQEASDLLSAEIQRAFYGEITVPEALANAEQAVNAVLGTSESTGQ